MPPKLTQFSLNLPFGIGGVTIELSDEEKAAAWDLYVEFSTRVATQGLEPGQGSAREALNSIYKLFAITRETLKKAGPVVAHGPNSFGPLAIRILNEEKGLRSFLGKWHTELGAFEDEQKMQQRKVLAPGVEPIIDEAQWPKLATFHNELKSLGSDLSEYVDALAEMAGVKE
jgi:hypothetical protein